jgi:hypothetical protein
VAHATACEGDVNADVVDLVEDDCDAIGIVPPLGQDHLRGAAQLVASGVGDVGCDVLYLDLIDPGVAGGWVQAVPTICDVFNVFLCELAEIGVNADRWHPVLFSEFIEAVYNLGCEQLIRDCDLTAINDCRAERPDVNAY